MRSPGSHSAVLRKIKLPNGHEFRYEARLVSTDQYGTWVAVPRGGTWAAPHDHGVLDFPSIVLLPSSERFVAWWVGRPTGPRLQIDIARTPVCEQHGWAFVDLELDIFVGRDGSDLTVLDHDELAERVEDGSLSPVEAETARATAATLVSGLRRRELPWVDTGWHHLARQ